MPDYLVLAYPIVATKTPNPITANDPSAAIAAFVEQVNWEALFDPVSQAKEVDYAVATLYFEAFEVRLAGDETHQAGTTAGTVRLYCYLHRVRKCIVATRAPLSFLLHRRAPDRSHAPPASDR